MKLLQRCYKYQKFLYFRLVKKESSIKRQLIAACLLLVFLFIAVVKQFHVHENSSIFDRSAELQQIEKASDCSTCDYQLAKDTHHFDGFPVVDNSPLPVSSYSFFHTPFVTSKGSTSSGRGPPALI